MGYLGLDHREIKKLGEVSGEAMRLYIAIASHAFGPKKFIVHAGWGALATRMGKPIVVDTNKVYGKKSHPDKRGKPVPAQEQRKNQKKRLILLARELERAGLITQKTEVGDDGEEKRSGKGLDRFRLVFKEQMKKHDWDIAKAKAEREGKPATPPTGDGNHPTGNSSNPRGEVSHPQRGNQQPPHNNKSNNKLEEENYNNKSLLEIEEEEIEEENEEDLNKKWDEAREQEDNWAQELREMIESDSPSTFGDTGFLQNPHEESQTFKAFTQQIELNLRGHGDFKDKLIARTFKDFSDHDWNTLREKFHHNYYNDEQIEMMRQVIHQHGFPDVLNESLAESFGWTRT